jgi:hypothetical protein
MYSQKEQIICVRLMSGHPFGLCIVQRMIQSCWSQCSSYQKKLTKVFWIIQGSVSSWVWTSSVKRRDSNIRDTLEAEVRTSARSAEFYKSPYFYPSLCSVLFPYCDCVLVWSTSIMVLSLPLSAHCTATLLRWRRHTVIYQYLNCF